MQVVLPTQVCLYKFLNLKTELTGSGCMTFFLICDLSAADINTNGFELHYLLLSYLIHSFLKMLQPSDKAANLKLPLSQQY